MLRALSKEYNSSDIVTILIFIYISTVYFSFAISNIVLGLGITTFIIGALFKKIELNFNNRNWLLYSFVVTVFILTLISTLLSKNTAIGLKYLWLRLPILIIPFILIFMEIKNESIRTGLKIFVIFSVVASIYTIYNAFIYRNEGIVFKPDLVFFITIIQHPYFGVFILTALISVIEFNLVKLKSLKAFIYVLFTFSIILTTSRLVFLLFIFIVLFYLYKRFSIKKTLFFGVILSLVALTFIASNKGIVEKFQSSITYENSPRLKLWNNSIKVVKSSKKLLFGIGIGDYYEKKQDVYFYRESENGVQGYNPHSQIIEFFITNGLFGLFVLLICIILGSIQIKQHNDFAKICFFIILMFSLTESILTRQFGVQIYSVFIPLIFKTNFKYLNNEIV